MRRRTTTTRETMAGRRGLLVGAVQRLSLSSLHVKSAHAWGIRSIGIGISIGCYFNHYLLCWLVQEELEEVLRLQCLVVRQGNTVGVVL